MEYESKYFDTKFFDTVILTLDGNKIGKHPEVIIFLADKNDIGNNNVISTKLTPGPHWI